MDLLGNRIFASITFYIATNIVFGVVFMYRVEATFKETMRYLFIMNISFLSAIIFKKKYLIYFFPAIGSIYIIINEFRKSKIQK